MDANAIRESKFIIFKTNVLSINVVSIYPDPDRNLFLEYWKFTDPKKTIARFIELWIKRFVEL